MSNTNHKPLDLSKPVQTRDGRPVRIVSTALCGDYPIGAVITHEDGQEDLESFTSEGSHWGADPSGSDLVNVPERKTEAIWVNLYPHGPGGAHTSADGALKARMRDGTTVKVVVEYVEGEDQL